MNKETHELMNQQLLDASKDGNLEEVRNLLASGADSNTTDFLGDTPMYWACRYGHLSVVQTLVEHGANIDYHNRQEVEDEEEPEESTPLCWASTYGHIDVVKYLLDQGADLHREGNGDGWTPLCFASYNGHLLVVKYLARKGARIDHRDKEGKTPFYLAVSWGHLKVAKYLLDHGANIDTRDRLGRTVLLETVQWHKIVSARFLIKNGADVLAQDIDRESPFLWAVNTHYSDAVYFILQRRPQLWKQLGQLLTKKHQEEHKKSLMNCGTTIDDKRKEGGRWGVVG